MLSNVLLWCVAYAEETTTDSEIIVSTCPALAWCRSQHDCLIRGAESRKDDTKERAKAQASRLKLCGDLAGLILQYAGQTEALDFLQNQLLTWCL